MFFKCVCFYLTVILVTVSARTASLAKENIIPEDNPRSSETASILDELRFAYNVYKNCDGDASCLKLKLVSVMDRVARSASKFSLLGFSFVKDSTAPVDPLLTESEIEANLPRSLGDKEEKLNELIVDRVGNFLTTHSLQIKLPSGADISRAFSDEEGRGKKKKLSGLLTLPLLLGAALVPLLLGGLALLAGKALLTAKAALLLAGVIAFKKLFGSSSLPFASHDNHDVVVPAGHGGPGWGRSYTKDAQNLAYSAYVPNSTNQ